MAWPVPRHGGDLDQGDATVAASQHCYRPCWAVFVAALASWVSFDAIVWLAHDPPGLGKHVGAHLDVWPAVALDHQAKKI